MKWSCHVKIWQGRCILAGKADRRRLVRSRGPSDWREFWWTGGEEAEEGDITYVSKAEGGAIEEKRGFRKSARFFDLSLLFEMGRRAVHLICMIRIPLVEGSWVIGAVIRFIRIEFWNQNSYRAAWRRVVCLRAPENLSSFLSSLGTLVELCQCSWSSGLRLS